ncbi:MAG: phosphate ABC transporter permease subunit PstC [Solirubrobacteraceae bacterium]
MSTEAATVSAGDRLVRGRSPRSRLADPIFQGTLAVIAALVLLLIGFFFVFLISKAGPALSHQGVFSFIFTNDWNPSREIFGGWPLVAGTIITSAIALVVGVPIAVAGALFVSELCPLRFRGALTMLIELLAAVPSVVYGLWGIFVVIPALKPFQQSLADAFSFLPFVGGPVAGPSYFIAGLILAIMILPIVSAISREVIATVPQDLKEASLALGATRWEMLRTAVLPYARSGIVGASMLGLGRAIGETIAVTLVIGNASTLGTQVFDQGYTLAAVIANEFGEAANDKLHSGALIAAGLVLFVLTLVVNAIARALVLRAERRASGSGGPVPVVAVTGSAA